MTLTETANAKIVDRIQKLLALANNVGATEAEATLAMTKAQEFLAEHNLTMAQVFASSGVRPAEKRERTAHKGRSAMYKYQRTVMEALADTNFCMYFLNEGWQDDKRGQEHYCTERNTYVRMRKVKQHILLGSESNVTIVQMMYDYIVGTMDRLLPYEGMEKRGKDALAWLDGCAERIKERLEQRKLEMLRENQTAAQEAKVRTRHPAAAKEPGTALVVLADVYGSEDDLNKDALYGYEPGTTARRRRDQEARDALIREYMKANPGVSYTHASYLAQGMELPNNIKDAMAKPQKPQEPTRPETAAERRKREAQERKDQRWWDAYQRREQRARQQREERRNDPVFQAGARAGNDIGLDPQVTENRRNKLS